jgi:monoterpene epsilon-lactone hydrolase
VLSPLYSDLRNFPATLFVTSTRDVVLSGTSILHRAFLRAGVDAQLVVFEALPHAFWHDPTLPESKEANQLMAAFFDRHLGK